MFGEFSISNFDNAICLAVRNEHSRKMFHLNNRYQLFFLCCMYTPSANRARNVVVRAFDLCKPRADSPHREWWSVCGEPNLPPRRASVISPNANYHLNCANRCKSDLCVFGEARLLNAAQYILYIVVVTALMRVERNSSVGTSWRQSDWWAVVERGANTPNDLDL